MITPQIICNIIQKYMGLCDDQIWIYNQRRKIPPTQGLFIVIGMVSTVPFGNNQRYLGTIGNYRQEISQMMQETLSINLFSYDDSAVYRLPEMIGSFQSTYAEQLQEKYAFQIGVVPSSISDTSFLEASAILFRQTVTIKVLRSYSKVSESEFYDTFNTEIYNEDGKVAEYGDN